MLYSRRQGFTLIEILITVAIIGVIAGIAVPSIVKSRAKSKLSNCEQNMRAIAHACDSYINDYSESALAEIGDASLITTLHDKGYLAEVPTCPCGGTYSVTTYDNTSDTEASRKKYGDFCISCVDGDHTAAGCDAAEYPKLTSQGMFIHTAAEVAKL